MPSALPRRRPAAAATLLVALVALLLASAPARAAKPLDERILAIVAASPVGASASVAVRDDDGGLVVAVRADRARVPASNQKLVTTLAALRVLGAEHRLETSLVGPAPVDGVVRGDVRLVGGGDPTFSTPAFGDAAYGVFTASPQELARRLRASGVRRITGRLLADAAAFDDQVAGPGWKPSFTPTECPPLSALTVDRAPADPALAAARRVRLALRAEGIRVGPVGAEPASPADGTTLASVRSAPVRTLAGLAGKNSDNFVAEMLLKAVAAAERTPGTTARGAALARRAIGDEGVPTRGIVVADGSGLSSDNRISTGALALLLARIDDDPSIRLVFRRSLAVAGVDGTLAHRMTRGPARGAVQAKTGTLNDVSALSGYAGDYAFSVIVQAPGVSQPAAHALQDRIAQVLVRASAG
jgi:D-alanyl-D-alanine carboxypeptidase/D-alanyl-D-alanine-endopeptidase (penicillin-binding protein 4)